MDVTRQELAAHFALLNDDELLSEFQSADLTEPAKAVAVEELRRRGFELSSVPTEPPAESEAAPAAADLLIDGDLVAVERVSTPAEAHMLRSRLEFEGIPATVTDDNMVQILSSMTIGGVRVLVPEAHLARARAIAQAIKRATTLWKSSKRRNGVATAHRFRAAAARFWPRHHTAISPLNSSLADRRQSPAPSRMAAAWIESGLRGPSAVCTVVGRVLRRVKSQ